MSEHVDPAAKETLESLRRFHVPIAGQERAIVLHPPGYESIVRGLMEPEDRNPRERGIITGELVQVVDVDDKPTLADHADPILDDAVALDTILRARERLYRFLVEQGRIVAVCPACGARTELDLELYAKTLKLPPWRVTDGRFIAAPALAQPSVQPALPTKPYEERPVVARRLAARPVTPPRAGRIDCILPSARLGITQPGDAVSATLGDVDQSREIEAWRKWASPRIDQPSERIHYHADHPGFRAMLRLAVALVELRTETGELVELTPEAVANMYLADVQFLDLVYTATHDLAVETAPSCTVRCSCGHAYLPVR